MGTAYSGVDGTVTADGTNQCVTGFTFDMSIEEKDATTTCDGGWDYPVATSKRVEGSFDVNYDPAKALHKAGDVVALVLKLPTTHTAQGEALITKTAIKSGVKDVVTIQYSFKSRGPWTLP